MKTKLLRFVCLLMCLIIALSLAGCGVENAQITWYDFGAEYSAIDSCTVAQNANYSLIWDKDTYTVTLYDKKNDVSYSNVPQDAADNTTQPNVYAAVAVSYIEGDTLNTSTANSHTSAVKKNAISAEKVENGIKVTYYLENVAISVPVTYTLREDSVRVSVDPAEIGEDEQLCYKVTLMPFLCSVNNNSASGDNYLFVPSGSGALIYPKTTSTGITQTVSEQIYGDDLLMTSGAQPTSKESVHLPVYGAKNGNSAVCAIVESADTTAEITTNVGSAIYGYSAVYSSFYIRGSQVSTATYMGGMGLKKTLFCAGKTEEEIAVGFYPLYGEDASYSGMAKTYQNYLIDKKGLTADKNDTLLNAEIIGGVNTKKFAFGVPYSSLSVLSDFEDVVKIAEELGEISSDNINIKLRGFGQSGLDIGKIGGAFKYNSKFGSVKKLADIADSTSLYFDFDILRFEEAGNGANKFNGVARTAVGEKANKRYSTIALSENDWTSSLYSLVRRDKLEDLGAKAVKKADKWNIGGISFDTLTSSSYSDYSSAEYYAKQNFDTQTQDILAAAKESDLKIAASGTNAYAAIVSDHIYNTPTRSSGYQVYDVDVPFYQMVFKGYSSMSVKSLNLSENYNKTFLKAVETGTGLSYSLIDEYNPDLISAGQNIFYSTVYEDNSENIAADVEKYEKLFESVKNVPIESHRILGQDLYETVFENGVTVYVNYGDADMNADGTVVPAGGFSVKGV